MYLIFWYEMTGKYNLTINKGSDFLLTLGLKKRNGLWIDLTGFTARAQIKVSHDSDDVLAIFTVNFLSPRIDGHLTLVLPVSITTNLNFYNAYYDIKLIDLDSKAHRILEGLITLEKEITP